MILLYVKFNQNNARQILLESTEFYGRYDKIHFGVFSAHSVVKLLLTNFDYSTCI